MKIKHIILGLGIALSPMAVGVGVVNSSSVEDVERPAGEGTPISVDYETWESNDWKKTWNNKNEVNHLYGYDEYIVYRSLKTGLNPSFVSAIIMYESAWGTSNAVVKHNNPSGIIDPKTYKLKSYDTLYEGIDDTIEFLVQIINEQEITHSLEFSKYYAPSDDGKNPFGYNIKWMNNMYEITERLGGFDGSFEK